MANRNTKLGGTNWTEEGLKPTDINDTNDTIVGYAGIGIAQNAYQVLQSNNVFENKNFLSADEFISATGTNNTVNTGTSTASFVTDHYRLSVSASGSDITETAQPTLGSNVLSTGKVGHRIQTKAACFLSSITKHASCTATTAYLHSDAGTVLGTATFSGNTATFSSPIELTDATFYRVLVDKSASIYTKMYNPSPGYPFLGTNLDFTTGSVVNTNDTSAWCIVSVASQNSVTSTTGTVVCDTNIKILDGTEGSIAIYADKTLPTNTTMTVDVSDGTTTLSAQALDEVIGLSTLTASSDLKLTFNLATTDTNVMPEIKGWGIFIK